jgi:hypothetical protein
MIEGSAKLFGLSWSGLLLAGVLFTLLGLWGRYMDRNKTQEEKSRSHNAYGSEKVYWAGFIGPPLIVIALILLIA